MNSFKAEEISLASFGHLIAYAKLFSSLFRHIIFSHESPRQFCCVYDLTRHVKHFSSSVDSSGGARNLFLEGPCIKFFIVCMKSKILVITILHNSICTINNN